MTWVNRSTEHSSAVNLVNKEFQRIGFGPIFAKLLNLNERFKIANIILFNYTCNQNYVNLVFFD